MKLEVHLRPFPGDWHTYHFFQTLLDALRVRFRDDDVRLVDVGTLGLSDKLLNYHGSVASPHMMRLVNPDTGLYSVISFWDNNYDLFQPSLGWRPERLRQLISSCGFSRQHYATIQATAAADEVLPTVPVEILHTPFTYNIYAPSSYPIIDRLYAALPLPRHRRSSLSFRGLISPLRTQLLEALPPGAVEVYDIRKGGLLPREAYLVEITTHRVGLSLNGAGEICNRDMEILGLGVPLFRPALHCEFHDPLVPDVHYIKACDAPDVMNAGSFRFSDPERAAVQLLKTWERVRADNELLESVAANGRQWYERNVRFSRQIELALSLLEVDRLQ